LYLSRAKARLRHLHKSRSGLAAVEFALSLPLLLVAGLYGTETANYALTIMKVSEVATHLADNASRIGDTSTITNRAIFEADVADLLAGAQTQGGSKLDFYGRGRAIISSLEIVTPGLSCGGKTCPGNPTDGVQFIHWQRCQGVKNVTSDYGDEYDEMPSGIGPVGQEITVEAGTAAIFVEVTYDYQPLISSKFIGTPSIKAVASFTQRDNIDLSGLKKVKNGKVGKVAECNKFTTAI
jgi:hypothetical protein